MSIRSNYKVKALRQIENFMSAHNLFPSCHANANGRGVIAVSGGMDSMFLLWALSAIFKRKGLELLAVHINHGTRKECVNEEAGVVNFARSLDVNVKVFSLDNLPNSNFESWARKERYKIFETLIEAGDLLYTAHHIDDSFEWSLLSQFKSSSLRPVLGIPVTRGSVCRPLMCMTRAHIEKCVRSLQLPYYVDSSNTDLNFERNYIRNAIIPLIKSRFPTYLKHYVYRSNDLARKLGVHRVIGQTRLLNIKFSFGTVAFMSDFSTNFTGQDEELIKIIQSISSSERGVLRTQVKKLIEASKNGKMGPLTFSGGINCSLFSGVLVFLKKDMRVSLNFLTINRYQTILGKDLEREFLAGRAGLGIVLSKDESLIKNVGRLSKIFGKEFVKTDYNAYAVSKLLRVFKKMGRKHLNTMFIVPDMSIDKSIGDY